MRRWQAVLASAGLVGLVGFVGDAAWGSVVSPSPPDDAIGEVVVVRPISAGGALDGGSTPASGQTGNGNGSAGAAEDPTTTSDQAAVTADGSHSGAAGGESSRSPVLGAPWTGSNRPTAVSTDAPAMINPAGQNPAVPGAAAKVTITTTKPPAGTGATTTKPTSAPSVTSTTTQAPQTVSPTRVRTVTETEDAPGTSTRTASSSKKQDN